MAEEKKTRIFSYREDPNMVKEVWPKDDPQADWVEGTSISESADYMCVSAHIGSSMNYWSVRPGPKNTTGPSFRINMCDDHKEHYADLARQLEDHAHTAGLIILIC